MEQPSVEQQDTLFLPDFCDIRLVFAVVLVGELLSFVLVLTPIEGVSKRDVRYTDRPTSNVTNP